MVSQLIKKSKYLTQSIYNLFINSISFSNCICKCGSRGRFHMHGYYKRSVKNPSGKVKISILRVKCTSCGGTHAILHPSIVPYSQILLEDTIDIILSDKRKELNEIIINNNPEITESDVRYVFKKYTKYWKERIISLGNVPIEIYLRLVDFQKCVSNYFLMAFMQIKRCYYKVF